MNKFQRVRDALSRNSKMMKKLFSFTFRNSIIRLLVYHRWTKRQRSLLILLSTALTLYFTFIRLNPLNHKLRQKVARAILAAKWKEQQANEEQNPQECLKIKDEILFPLCSMKIASFNKTWNQNCHGARHGVNLSDPCSVRMYLSEVEAWCPVLPWRQKHSPFKKKENQEFAHIRTSIDGILVLLKDKKYAWPRARASSMWSQWVKAVTALSRKQSNLATRKRKKILLFMGACAEFPWLLERAFHGAPLGESVQWTDLLCALYILGHDIVLSSNYKDMERYLPEKPLDGCYNKTLGNNYDVIFTDIVGVGFFKGATSPGHYSRYRCKFRVLDSFGTDAEFNYEFYKGNITGGRSGWGDLNLQLLQFMTMYPHSPDNSFLGFAVPTSINKHTPSKKRTKALVYGKEARFWKGRGKSLEVIHKHLQIHGTVAGNKNDFKNSEIPDYIVHHGVVNTSLVVKFLQESKVFVGLGEPYEGPAPLEALANGCFYINPKFDPPLNRINSGFFRGKPVMRQVTSQNPYTEVYVGKPSVHTVDINNLEEVENAIREILKSKVQPHLPYEFTAEGFLQRINAYVENQEFCRPLQWPPLQEMKVQPGESGESCAEVCWRRGLICEPTFFREINSIEEMKRNGISCGSVETKETLVAPAYSKTDAKCLLQQHSILFNCRASGPEIIRLCPCRSFLKEQVALCKTFILMMKEGPIHILREVFGYLKFSLICYGSLPRSDSSSEEEAVTTIENCIRAIRAWMEKNKLMLNDDKTEILLIGTQKQLLKVLISRIFKKSEKQTSLQ